MDETFVDDIFKQSSFDEVSTSLNDTNHMRTPSALSMEQSPYVPVRPALASHDLSDFIKDIRQQRSSAVKLEERLDRVQRRLGSTNGSNQPTARTALKTDRDPYPTDRSSSYAQLNQHFRSIYRTPSVDVCRRQMTVCESARIPVRPVHAETGSGIDLSQVCKGAVPWIQSREDLGRFARDSSAPRSRDSATDRGLRYLSYHRANSIWKPVDRVDPSIDLTSTLLNPEKRVSLSTQIRPKSVPKVYSTPMKSNVQSEIEDFQRSISHLRKVVLGQNPVPSLLRKPPNRLELERRYLSLAQQVEATVKELEEVRFQNILLAQETSS